MAALKWTYMLRLMNVTPNRVRMDRLAEYLSAFAATLGTDNAPVFRGIVQRSVGIAATVPTERQVSAHRSLLTAQSMPASRPGKALAQIERLMGEDAIGSAQLLNQSGNVIYLIRATAPAQVDEATVWQEGAVDGMVTGMVGADDTMHLYLRDALSRDLRLIVRDENLARRLLGNFRDGWIRVRLHGTWTRTEVGWVPESNRCTVDDFEVLDEASPVEVFEAIAQVAGNGWREVADANVAWKEIRGIQ